MHQQQQPLQESSVITREIRTVTTHTSDQPEIHQTVVYNQTMQVSEDQNEN